MVNHDLKALESLLSSVQSLYMADDPKLKAGMGHEVEHIKGALHRADEIVSLLKEYNVPDKINREMAITASALHDIGNVFSRKFHNHYAYGVIMGGLTFQDIVAVPGKLPAKLRQILAEIPKDIKINSYPDILKYFKGDIDVCNLISKEQSKITTVFDIISKFDETYGKNKIGIEKQNQFDADLKYSKALHEITDKLKEIYSPEEIQTLANAVQDHNIDFDDRVGHIGERYQARNIYGMIIADADKDNVSMTFNLRTLAYAINEWTKKEIEAMQKLGEGKSFEEYWTQTDNGVRVANVGHCLSHIRDQAFERFRAQWTNDVEAHVYEIMKYKKDLTDIAGCCIVQADNESNKRDDGSKKATIYEYKDPNTNESKYYTLSQPVDIYSQLDVYYQKLGVFGLGEDPILSLRKPFLRELATYVSMSKEEFLEQQACLIEASFNGATTIEQAVDICEAAYYHITVEDNQWDNLIHSLLDNAERDRHQSTQLFGIGEKQFIQFIGNLGIPLQEYRNSDGSLNQEKACQLLENVLHQMNQSRNLSTQEQQEVEERTQ